MKGAAVARRAATAAFAALLCVWAGCSVDEHYKLLSFFFDGVPPPLTPEQRAEAARRGGAAAGAARMVSSHPAYVAHRCAECHGDRSSFGFTTTGFTDLDAGACVSCHGDMSSTPHVHGPVAAGNCLWCHVPHESQYPHLLIIDSPALCLRCHQLELDNVAVSPAHENLGRNCLECHYAHGGDDPYFLRPADTWSLGPEVPAETGG